MKKRRVPLLGLFCPILRPHICQKIEMLLLDDGLDISPLITTTMPVQTRSMTKNASLAPEIKKNTPSAEILNWIENHGQKNATTLYLINMSNMDSQFIQHFVSHTKDLLNKLTTCKEQENQVALSVAMWEYFRQNISLVYKYHMNYYSSVGLIQSIIEKMCEQQKQIPNGELSSTDPIWVEKLQTSLVEFKSEFDELALKMVKNLVFMHICEKRAPVLYLYLMNNRV